MHLADPELAAQVFGRRVDMWTTRATDLLDRVGLRYDFVDLDDRGHAHVVRRLIEETRHYQTPYVYVRGKFVGGFAELDELHRLGLLAGEPQPPRGQAAVAVAGREREFVPPALIDGPARK